MPGDQRRHRFVGFNYEGRDVYPDDTFTFENMFTGDTVDASLTHVANSNLYTDYTGILFHSDHSDISSSTYVWRAVLRHADLSDHPGIFSAEAADRSRWTFPDEDIETEQDFRPIYFTRDPIGTQYLTRSGSRVEYVGDHHLRLVHSVDGQQEEGYIYRHYRSDGSHQTAYLTLASVYDPSLEAYLAGGI